MYCNRHEKQLEGRWTYVSNFKGNKGFEQNMGFQTTDSSYIIGGGVLVVVVLLILLAMMYL